MSKKGLEFLAKKKLLPNLKGTNLIPCTHCLVGKQHRHTFHRSYPHRCQSILDLVHTDVCSMNTKNLGGATYFVTFIDDYSKKIWAYLLRSKYQVIDVFKHFHASIERETEKQLKHIRADNGGEYRGPFEKYCKDLSSKLERLF